jgi:[ribosomal protein S5]-alanine N-acetyltransferase
VSSPYFLCTERLGFRLWAPDDFALAWALWSDPEVTRRIGGPFSELQVRERLDREIATQEAHGIQYWPVFLRTTGGHIGCCGLRPYNLDEPIYALGFHLRPGCWGLGYAGEAARAVIDHAFGVLGARALFAGHHPENDPSRRLLAKLGFRYTHDELYPPTGIEHPSYLLTREERGA